MQLAGVPGEALAGALAGAMAYTLTPGPGFLAMLGIGAGQGQAAGARFLAGHFAGDILWATLALVAILGAGEIGALVFDLLGVVCGLYLGQLGLRALRTTQHSTGTPLAVLARPWRRGLVFGLTNPKAYPVALATFTALLTDSAGLAWPSLPPLLLAAACGFVLADVVLVAFSGAGGTRRFYRAHELAIIRVSGLIFLAFALAALQGGARGLLHLASTG